jgi:glycosyltransferase involved in cell wall biosynthesis
MGVRRFLANGVRSDASASWPIDQTAGMTPPGWPGWPDGKKFAVVLTHDVEWTRGLNRIERVIGLERKYGFRSSFNLIPEREYRVDDSTRRMIEESGCEVGVHCLKHDGKLYSSKAVFASRATRIRKYAEEWKACGFRSAHMQHQLGWLHLLGMEYDLSTFDTDPFEPESDGVRTIFPFWVPGPSGGGYVELPYTLAQDHTLFVVLREQTIDIWKRKLAWIAAQGGMALINVHPDYTCFEGVPARDEASAARYEEFLDYVKSTYEGYFWHALPREVSRFYTSTVPLECRNSRKKICMVTYSNYENDSRVRRYAESLAKRGDLVDVIAITNKNDPLEAKEICGVNVLLIQRRENNERGKWSYMWRLMRFLIVSSRLLTRRHREQRYDLIHVHNVPDFLIYAAWYPKLTGARLILDIHDLVPELFANKFLEKQTGLYVRCIKIIEKACTSFADHIIIANHLWEKTLVSRAVRPSKCSVFLNHIDTSIFYRRQRTRNDNKFVMVFPGSWQWHQGLDIAIEALALLKDKVPEAELHLYGGGGGAGTQESLASLAKRLGLDGRVKFCGDVSMGDIAEALANADIGIVPKRADSFGNEAYSTKIMEYMSQGLPVVASRTKIDTFYFDDSTIRFFPSGDSQAMADAILDVKENPVLRASLVENGLQYARSNGWDTRRRAYCDLVDSLATEHFVGIIPENTTNLTAFANSDTTSDSNGISLGARD